MVKIKLEIVGHISQEIEEELSALQVHESLKNAIVEIYRKIEEMTKMTPSMYLVLYKGMNISSYLKKNNDAKIQTGDIFKVLPLISGG